MDELLDTCCDIKKNLFLWHNALQLGLSNTINISANIPIDTGESLSASNYNALPIN